MLMRKAYEWFKAVVLWVALTAMVLGGTSQIWNVVQDRQLDAVVHDMESDRVTADIQSCESGNRLRASIRELAIDLGADEESRAIVNARFPDRDCTAIVGYEDQHNQN